MMMATGGRLSGVLKGPLYGLDGGNKMVFVAPSPLVSG